jgi:hypothetical protein
MILNAISRLSLATGLQFIDDGPTTEAPTFQRAEYQPERYGDRWAPVLIAWVTTEENPDFAASVEGESGSVIVSQNNGPRIYVTGIVELDSSKLSTMLLVPGGASNVYAIILHELGHLVGLAHVADVNQLMFPESGHGVTDFNTGDLAGAAILGRGACVPGL